jgi:meiotically up-regulated gene 157 (Mug157) protein
MKLNEEKFEKVIAHLEKKYALNVFQQGIRLSYVVYVAKETLDEPFKTMISLMHKAYDLSQEATNYTAFERSIYRELKRMFPNEEVINVVESCYKLANEI